MNVLKFMMSEKLISQLGSAVKGQAMAVEPLAVLQKHELDKVGGGVEMAEVA